MAVQWDFLWFVLNPHFGVSRFSKAHVWWFRSWYLGIPRDYYVGLILSFVGLAGRRCPGREPRTGHRKALVDPRAHAAGANLRGTVVGATPASADLTGAEEIGVFAHAGAHPHREHSKQESDFTEDLPNKTTRAIPAVLHPTGGRLAATYTPGSSTAHAAKPPSDMAMTFRQASENARPAIVLIDCQAPAGVLMACWSPAHFSVRSPRMVIKHQATPAPKAIPRIGSASAYLVSKPRAGAAQWQ